MRVLQLLFLVFFRFSSNGGGEGKEDLYTDTIRQVIDHVLVQHFQTFAYKCDGCAHTFNTKVTLQTLNIYVIYRELLQVLLLRRGADFFLDLPICWCSSLNKRFPRFSYCMMRVYSEALMEQKKKFVPT